MRSSNRNISRENIELEIYKTFELFNESKSIKISDFLSKLELDLFKDNYYRRIKFYYESLFKIILFKKLKGLKYQNQVIQYLRAHQNDRLKLNLKDIPDRRTIGYFLRHILDNETTEMLDFIKSKIEEISEKFGILLDIKTLEPDIPQKKTKERNMYLKKNEKTKEICRIVKKRFSPFIDLNLKQNTVYKKKQFIDLLIHMGMTRDFAENGNKTYRELRPYGCPDADTLLYHLKRYKNHKEIQKMYITLFEIVWEMTRKTDLFNAGRSFDVAVDFTEWYFYGDKTTPMVVGKEPDRGTTKCYKFATINIVESGKPFTLLALPVGPFDEKQKILSQLISYALNRIKIKRVYVDRGFFDSKSIKIFNRFHLKYLMPATQITTVKEVIKITPSPSVITDFEMKDVKFNLILVDEKLENGKKVKRAFATNEEYNENDVNLAERLFDLYSKRWGIETSYRVKKNSYLPKTTSKNYQIRLFYFMFSVLLYNLWILADILIWLALYGIIEQDHLVTSKLFGTILYTINPDYRG